MLSIELVATTNIEPEDYMIFAFSLVLLIYNFMSLDLHSWRCLILPLVLYLDAVLIGQFVRGGI